MPRLVTVTRMPHLVCNRRRCCSFRTMLPRRFSKEARICKDHSDCGRESAANIKAPAAQKSMSLPRCIFTFPSACRTRSSHTLQCQSMSFLYFLQGDLICCCAQGHSIKLRSRKSHATGRESIKYCRRVGPGTDSTQKSGMLARDFVGAGCRCRLVKFMSHHTMNPASGKQKAFFQESPDSLH